MLFSQMADFVRQQCDADIDDAPNDVLSMYARAAYDDIRRRRTAWPHKYVEYPLTTSAGVAKYPLDLVAPGDLERVSYIIDPTRGALGVYGREAIASYAAAEGLPQQGDPEFVSIGPKEIELWPTPITSEVYTVAGYQQFALWPDEASFADLPREFDIPICWAMCRDHFMFQEEPEIAQLYDNRFEVDVARFIGKLNQSFGSHATPTYFTGSFRRRTTRR